MKRTLFITAAVPLLVLVGGAGSAALAAPATFGIAPSTDPDPSDDPVERFRQFTQCLRDNGIDLPDPVTADGPVSLSLDGDQRGALDEAIADCEAYAPGIGAGGRSIEVDPAFAEQAEEFEQCLRDNGVDVPEPGEDGGIVVHAEVGGAGAPPPPPRPAPGDGPPSMVVGGAGEALSVPDACKDLLPAPPEGAPVVIGESGGSVAGVAGAGGNSIEFGIDVVRSAAG